jgi:hypothetical protein
MGWLAVVALVAGVRSDLAAQRLRAPEFGSLRPGTSLPRAPESVQVGRPQSGGTLAFAGLIGAVGGGFAGGIIGSKLENCEAADDYCGVGGAALGASIGLTLVTPLAIHMANDNRGNYWLSTLGSFGVAVGTWALAGAADDATPLIFLPVGQIIVSTIIERKTTPVAAGSSP